MESAPPWPAPAGTHARTAPPVRILACCRRPPALPAVRRPPSGRTETAEAGRRLVLGREHPVVCPVEHQELAVPGVVLHVDLHPEPEARPAAGELRLQLAPAGRTGSARPQRR